MRSLFIVVSAVALAAASSAWAAVVQPNEARLNAAASISLADGPRQGGPPGEDGWGGAFDDRTYDANGGFFASGIQLESRTRASWSDGEHGGVRFDGQMIIPNLFESPVDATYADLPAWSYNFTTLSDATFTMQSRITMSGPFEGQGRWDMLVFDDQGESSVFHLSEGLGADSNVLNDLTSFSLSRGRTYTVSLINLDHLREKNQTLKNVSSFIWSIDERITAGVPEPSTWALLTLGFGTLGGMLRRRRALTTEEPPATA